MSAMSSISSSDPSLLAQQAGQQERTGRNRSPQDAAKCQAKFEDAVKAAGGDPANAADIEQQVQDAIANARQGSGGGEGDRAAVRTAIDTVLKQNGVDPAKFRSALESSGQADGPHRAHHGRPHHAKPADDENGSATPRPAGSNTAPPAQEPGLGSAVDIAA